MDRVAFDESKIVLRVPDERLIKTKYGYAFILNYHYAVFLKEWQVNKNNFGIEVVLNKDYFLPKTFGCHPQFSGCFDNLKWENWVSLAKEQSEEDKDGLCKLPVYWNTKQEVEELKRRAV